MRKWLRVVMVCLWVAAGCARPGPGPAPGARAPEVGAAPQSGPVAEGVTRAGPAAYRAGIWLEARWVGADATPAAAADLVKRLAARGITDLYVRTGPYASDGTLPLPDTAAVAALHRAAAARGLRLWAWLPGLRRRLDLSAGGTVASAARWAGKLAATGFDGVQLDLEPTADDDDGYLALLTAIRGALPKGTRLGAATHLIRPKPAVAEWSAGYFARVAARVDQVAVMAYDTAAVSPADFREIVAYQTQTALAGSPRSTEVLIGVPTYADRTERHSPETEPLAAGLQGVADGWRRSDLGARVTGWAIYAEFTTDTAEWAQWQQRPR